MRLFIVGTHTALRLCWPLLWRFALRERVLCEAAMVVGGFLNLTMSSIMCLTCSSGLLVLGALSVGSRLSDGASLRVPVFLRKI